MPTYSNVSSVPLSMAVFLATDNYDSVDEPNYISATSLLKPLRQLILAARLPKDESPVDLSNMIASRMGSAIHDAIERAWKDNYANAMKILGYPVGAIKKIRINPPQENQEDGIIPIYLEQRAYKKVGKWTIGGKYDFIGDGRVEDFKSTSVYTYIHKTNDDKYIMQGSLYRWLNPKLVTRDEMAIQFIFTDWQGSKAKTDPNYPPKRIHQKLLKLKSVAETESFVRRKLALIEQYWDAPEDQIPECTDEDLWRSEPVFKFYKNPEKTARSTKNFDNKQDAYTYMAAAGQGIVIEKPGQVTGCKYCAAFPLCSQKDRLIASGDLLMEG